jgi:hypothetical protein
MPIHALSSKSAAFGRKHPIGFSLFEVGSMDSRLSNIVDTLSEGRRSAHFLHVLHSARDA